MKPYKKYVVILILLLLLSIGVSFFSCTGLFPTAETTATGSNYTTTESLTGWRYVFANYGTWIWLLIIWLLPLILTTVYGVKRKIPTWGLWFLLTFFTGWLGYIIMVIFTNFRRREIIVIEQKVNEKISEAIKNKEETNNEKSYKDTTQEKYTSDEYKYCMTCGTKLPSQATYCKSCGKKVE